MFFVFTISICGRDNRVWYSYNKYQYTSNRLGWSVYTDVYHLARQNKQQISLFSYSMARNRLIYNIYRQLPEYRRKWHFMISFNHLQFRNIKNENYDEIYLRRLSLGDNLFYFFLPLLGQAIKIASIEYVRKSTRRATNNSPYTEKPIFI